MNGARVDAEDEDPLGCPVRLDDRRELRAEGVVSRDGLYLVEAYTVTRRLIETSNLSDRKGTHAQGRWTDAEIERAAAEFRSAEEPQAGTVRERPYSLIPKRNAMPPNCYFQGCEEPGGTKEHVPARAFFPADKRDQLLTVPACETHNTAKSKDDIYVLAQICMNASPAHDSREIFMQKVAPQLGFNEGAFRKTLARDAVPLGGGAVAYKVDAARFDRFFDALSFGIVYKSAKRNVPKRYSVRHVYHAFVEEGLDPKEKEFREHLVKFYSEDNKDALDVLDFGELRTLNATVYTARIFGLPDFKSSITIAHLFFGKFRVTSMLSNVLDAFGSTP